MLDAEVGDIKKFEATILNAEQVNYMIQYVSDLNDTLKREQISPRTASDARVKLEKELEYGWDGQQKTIKLIPAISDNNEEK